MARQIQGSQHDFTSGEIDVELKRNDEHPARKAGLRQMSNMRILNSGAIQDRPGRRAFLRLPNVGRTEEITMSAAETFFFAFGDDAGSGKIQIFNSVGTLVKTFLGLPWVVATVGDIVYAPLRNNIYITFPGMVPKVLAWDGATQAGWAISDYAELLVGNQKRTFFYRLSPQGVTILPSAQTGAVTVIASAPVFTSSHVGTRIRYVGRQILIDSFISPQVVNGTVQEALPGHQNLGTSTDPQTAFSIGDIILGSTSGSKGIITAIGAIGMDVQLLSVNASIVTINYFDQRTVSFTTGETIVGPGGSIVVGSAGPIDAPTIGVTLWDEEVMNPLRGYPASCFVDQFRLGFCDFPAVPNGIGWSAINSPTDIYVGPDPASAIFELAPEKVRVYYVVPGAESSEFVFCDKRLYYIRIDAQNPLRPGSVGFQTLSSDGCARVKPVAAQEMLVFADAGRSSVRAIEALGAYYRPFSVRNLTDFATHLFSDITGLAIPTADGEFSERYIYVLNASGSVVVGKYTVQDGKISPAIGWGPWPTNATVLWVAANGADVLFTSVYFGATIGEILDESRYLDASLEVNNLPISFTAPFGKGPLWWIPSQTVSLMDQVTRSMGVYQIDPDGFIIPQGNAGEDLTRLDLIAGQPWTSTVEPFTPTAQSGVDVGQRMKLRTVGQFAAYVIQSSGFMLGYLFSGKQTATSPAQGTLMNFRRFPAWEQGDDPTLPPPLRETAETYPPPGSTFDPRVVLIKDTPGPLQLLELGIEVSI